MSNDIVHKCCVCDADFRPGGLDENGKCAICRVEYPTAKSKKEALALNRPEIHLGKTLDVDGVRQIVKEELNAFKAEFKAEQVTATKIDNMAKARAAKQDKKDDNKGDE